MTLSSDSQIAILMSQIAVITALTQNFILLFYHSFIIFCKSKTSKSTVHYLSILTLLFLVIFLIGLFLTVFTLYPISIFTCKWIIILPMILWGFMKFSLYFLFVERLFRVFANSDFRFRSFEIAMARTLLISWWIILQTLVIIIVDGKLSDIRDNYCVTVSPLWLNGLVALSDFIICTIISILFSRRLLLLILNIDHQQPSIPTDPSMTSSSTPTPTKSPTNSPRSPRSIRTLSLENAENNAKATKNATQRILRNALKILRKSTLLTFIALITTELSLILSGAFGATPIWVGFDCMVNGWCIILMFVFHSKLYKGLCCCFEKCITVRCLECCSCYYCFDIAAKDEVVAMEIITTNAPK